MQALEGSKKEEQGSLRSSVEGSLQTATSSTGLQKTLVTPSRGVKSAVAGPHRLDEEETRKGGVAQLKQPGQTEGNSRAFSTTKGAPEFHKGARGGQSSPVEGSALRMAHWVRNNRTYNDSTSGSESEFKHVSRPLGAHHAPYEADDGWAQVNNRRPRAQSNRPAVYQV